MLMRSLNEKEVTKDAKTRHLAKLKAADPKAVGERCIPVSQCLNSFSATSPPLQNRHWPRHGEHIYFPSPFYTWLEFCSGRRQSQIQYQRGWTRQRGL